MSNADRASGGSTVVAQHQRNAGDVSPRAYEPSAEPVLAASNQGSVNKDSLAIDIRASSPNNALLPGSFRKPSDAGLKITTPVTPTIEHPDNFFTTTELKHRPAALVSRSSWRSQSSWDSTGATPSSFPSPSWSMSSPALANLSDVTPLPSPLVFNQSPDFRKFRTHSGSNASFANLAREEAAGLLLVHSRSISPQRKKKAYAGLGISNPPVVRDNIVGGHARDRSLSEYIPEHLQNARLRNVTAPVAVAEILQRNQQNELGNAESQMHRELFLTKSRGYAPESPEIHQHKLLTPPDSLHDVEEDTSMTEDDDAETVQLQKTTYRVLRKLGQGAFSNVLLASRKEDIFSQNLIAIKVVDHKLAQGSDEERIGTSITREIEILQDISHPCLPKLIAFENNTDQALLAMQYCRGGDLFELASQERELLTPVLIQRIFAELVDAVGYLHSNYIVHRDIKLENILLNLDTSSIRSLASPTSHPHPLITLTDLGLSKRIPEPPISPLLTHACGSPDYAAPELLLGQPYDGRLTDCWALGVLLYALIEGRLPFDPLPVQPGMTHAELKRRGVGSSVKHRIARCDWLWCEYGNRDGEWVDGGEGAALEGARLVVEGLLKKVNRGRWNVEKLRAQEWVSSGIRVEGGLTRKMSGPT